MREVRRALAVIVGGAASVVFGCGSSPTAPTAPTEPASFGEVYATFFPANTNARCNYCHGLQATDTSNGKLHMGEDKATAYAALVGKTSSSSHCGSRALVVPGDPEASLLYQKLSEPSPCGSRMPLGGALLSAAQREMVRSWIAAGAKDD
jgi:hypothetical protein